MTTSQESKLDRLHDIALRMEGKISLVDQSMKAIDKRIQDNEDDIFSAKKDIATLQSDKDKVVGALWLTGTSVFGLVVAFFANLFKHN